MTNNNNTNVNVVKVIETSYTYNGKEIPLKAHLRFNLDENGEIIAYYDLINAAVDDRQIDAEERKAMIQAINNAHLLIEQWMVAALDTMIESEDVFLDLGETIEE